MIFISILAFIVIFSLLILVHEFGHFSAARFFGVKVEEFGLGLPPKARRLFVDKKKTEYTLNWLPLGGFVRMKGEEFSKKLLTAKDSFIAQKVWKRIIIVCAGVAMNLLTGFVLFVIVFSVGTTILTGSESIDAVIAENPAAEFVAVEPLGMLVNEVVDDGAAAESELASFDFVEMVDGEIFSSSDEFTELLRRHAGEEIELSVVRRERRLEIPITPNADGLIGIGTSGPFTAVKLKYHFPQNFVEAGRETVRITGAITGAIGGLFGSILNFEMPSEIGGPIAIAKETFNRASSLLALLNFAALLSITLAVFNILPIPALDGGRLLFLIFEGILRRKVSPEWENKIHAAGYILLLGLIVVISWQDIFG